MHRSPRLSRRHLLAGLGGLLGAAATATRLPARAAGDTPPPHDPAARKLLFVIGATGGASIIDSFLPVTSDEVPASADPEQLNVYDPSMVVRPAGSEIRCVRPMAETDFLTADYSILAFLEAHYADLTVVTHEVTSVNHAVAQKRAVTGAGINRGQTIAEAVAAHHGAGLPLANCNMATGGYVEPGDDRSLVAHARAEIIADPRTYAMATHGSRGIASGLTSEQIEQARSVRERLDARSPFGHTYGEAPLRQQYLRSRSEVAPQLEQADAITKLMLLDTAGLDPSFELEHSPLREDLSAVFPSLTIDRWQQQGALAFLLAFYGLSCANTVSLALNPAFDGDDIIGAPLAFDFSHTLHRAAQNVMWGRVLRVVDGLVRLLKRFDYLGDPALGKMWDRSLIYVATDFGRDKLRPPGSGDYFGTGHHLNNGSILLSPLLRGNRVFGGVDPATLLTHGFDPRTGEPRLDSTIREGEIYSLVAQALGVDFPGRRDMSGLLT